ncbi:MAG TPA: alpha/beta fold hydrolase [Candidatus Binataceae bacterium]|nr:alpha/beta fold hydrolase [Candidatus Binataceae bacterium]
MSELKTISLRGGDFSVKYYQEGKGDHLVFLHSAGGLPGFTPELQALSEHYTVTAPILPGFGSSGVEHLHEDVQKLVFFGWDFVDAMKIDKAILVGHSFGGMMAAEMAATEPSRVKKLVLVAPAGLYVKEHPMLDIWATTPPNLMKAAFHNPESPIAKAAMATPTEHQAQVEAIVGLANALSTASRFLFPNGDRGLSERLYRIKAATLLLWGETDGIIPPQHADEFKRLLTSAASVKIQRIAGAGHVMFPEAPETSVKAILDFCAA